MTTAHPIEGQVVLLAGARASVTLEHLSSLLARVQRAVRNRREEYGRRYERIEGRDDVAYFLVDPDHWDDLGQTIELSDREIDAVGRTHAAQFRRDGRRLDRLEEFESALELREVVAVDREKSAESA
jgi:hypothetical protein